MTTIVIEIKSLGGETLGKFNHNIDHNYNEFINNIYLNCESISDDSENDEYSNIFLKDLIKIKYTTYSSINFDPYNVITYIKTPLPKIYSTAYAFALLKTDGNVISWGNLNHFDNSFECMHSNILATRNSDTVKEHLFIGSNVKNIYSTDYAFAALKNDGSVITWGDFNYGGNSDTVKEHLQSDIKKIYSGQFIFAALKNDGSIITWGRKENAIKPNANKLFRLTPPPDNLDLVKRCFSFAGGAALKNNGSVIAWGYLDNFVPIKKYLQSNVRNIYSNNFAFAALKNDGSVITWGKDYGSNLALKKHLSLGSGIIDIYSTSDAFAALRVDGSVITWGDPIKGGNSNLVKKHLSSGIINIYSTSSAFAALKNDGSVITWGDPEYGGDSDLIKEQLSSNVKKIYSNNNAFAALKNDGSVIIWGYSTSGSNSDLVKEYLQSDVKIIYSTYFAFAALKNDGSIIIWGDEYCGGNSDLVKEHLS
jgi:alpha-tubulin suppressor-like RCC1 family protein